MREFCLSILESGDLAAKLRPPRAADGGPLPDSEPGPPLFVERPVRAPELRMQSGAEKLPRPGELAEPAARAACLRRFAHHELMAVELFAWALLAWPELPAELRRSWLQTLADEQRHLTLYLERLEALGAKLGDEPLSDYFWLHVPRIRAHDRGPLAFLAAMGLTLEQANLDFTLLYRDAFRAAGDEQSARVLQQVHDDEKHHVKLAARWLERLKRPEESDIQAYADSVPFPLDAARAKGRRFDVAARRDAGLSDEMIEYVRHAKPHSTPAGSGSRIQLFPNLGAEEGDGWRDAARHPAVRASAILWATLFPRSARFVGVAGLRPGPLPESLARDADTHAFADLPVREGLVPWLATAEAATEADRKNVPLVGADPEVVTRVHDKAFARDVAARHGLLPAGWPGAVIDPKQLDPADVGALEAALRDWPEAARSRFVLKPRFGSSGRGRVAGRDGRVDTAQIRGALPRLASAGGALLEPWVDRLEDLSAQLWISADGDVRLLGTLAQEVTPTGVPGGHRGVIAADGLVSSGSTHDAALARAAKLLGRAAAEAGLRGFCGVDAFVFRDAGGAAVLHPAVELNARFTLGTIALGLLRRRLRLGPAHAFVFHVGAHAPRAAGLERLVLVDAEGESCGVLDVAAG